MASDDTPQAPGPLPPGDVAPIAIEDEMRQSYLDYAMSVIVSRALPDARDGLKPVHRRILYSMNENGYTSDKPYRKSARVVGDVMGKYHPHGDSAIYDAMVRMAQDFSMRLPLLDGQGNFGSMDNDPPAAMRYTEIRLDKAGEAMLEDIDLDTVDFQENYDNTTSEPKVLPARIPNLLVNGAGGIAVGMATNIPPHNLGEVIDACLALSEDPALTAEDLMQYVQGPDFPTGATILGRSGIRSALLSGKGSVVMRAKTSIEEVRKDRWAIVVHEIPYQVNKAAMQEKISEAVKVKRIEGISAIRDESDRDGVRVVIELKRDAMPEIVLNQLYRFSALQTSFPVNSLALLGGRPEVLNLRDMIDAFVRFRQEVITRRTRHLLGKARDRAHVLVGLAIAVANIDEMIRIIRNAPDPATAREEIIARDWPAEDVRALVELIDDPSHKVVDGRYRLSEGQARAILDLRLHRLTALGMDEIGNELQGLGEKITDYLEILSSRPRLMGILRDELIEIREKFATPRRTTIEDLEFEHDDEDLIPREDMVVTVSHAGYVKRVPLSTYRVQRRGGKGRAGMSVRDEDFVAKVYVVNTHTPVLFFSSAGKVYKMKTYRIPLAPPNGRGRAMQNLLPLEQDEVIQTLLPLPEDEAEWENYQLMFATRSGNVRRNLLSDFGNVMSNGKIAMKLDEGDSIVNVRICTGDDDVLLALQGGKCIRFRADDVRIFKGRDSTGVRGVRLAGGDRVIAMSILRHVEAEPAEARAYLKHVAMLKRGEQNGVDEPDTGDENGNAEEVHLTSERIAELGAAEQFIVSITENGYGKRSSAYEYRVTGRGGQGIVNIVTSARNGGVVASGPVDDSDHMMLVTNGGKLIRIRVDEVRIAGRNTQGVTLFSVGDGERVVSVTRLADADEDDEDENGAGPEEDGAENGDGAEE
ncbi:MAG: DNA gyrase subunit A [Minwuia sp.]|uniref:DNA gyrase subunit A n=1 Tax=Minwuia sp. TaxID=2493630 RepID=UPI003A8A5777